MRTRLLLLPFILLTGCATERAPAPTTTTTTSPVTPVSSPWGFFTGPFNVNLDDNGRKLHLLNDVYYTAPDRTVWKAPAGATVDGASIPQAFWSIIGGPLEGPYRNASIFHDVACDTKDRPWDAAARMFYDAMRCGGVGKRKGKIMYYAVYEFGPRWGANAPLHWWERLFNAAAARSALPENPIETPQPPTKEEIEHIKSFVEGKDPSLTEIQADAQKLRLASPASAPR